MRLSQGIYENIFNNEILSEINELKDSSVKKLPIDKDESSVILSSYLSKILKQKLEDNDSTEDNIKLVNKLIQDFSDSDENLISDNENFLAEVISNQKKVEQNASKSETARPETGFLYSSLFTGRGSKIPLYSEIKKDIESSDEIYFIISFLKLSGLNLIYEDLKKFCNQPGHKLRIITTTYCGITEPKAVQRIAELPNTEVRISYNTKKECLHAKSYIFIRYSGCSTAYIGSSNLSKYAHTEGLEWNIRVTNAENAVNNAKAKLSNAQYALDVKKLDTSISSEKAQLQSQLDAANTELTNAKAYYDELKSIFNTEMELGAKYAEIQELKKNIAKLRGIEK